MGQAAARPARAPGRRSGRGDRTRAALVDAALRLFREQGVEATSVDEITSAAAVAKGTFYVHFQRKQDVLLEQGADLVLAIREDPAMRGLGVAGLDPAAALRTVAAVTARLLEARSRHLVGRSIRELVGHREDWLRVLDGRPTLAAVIAPVVERGRAEGTIRTDLSAARLTQGLTILWLDTIIGWSERPEPRDLAGELEQALALWLGGART